MGSLVYQTCYHIIFVYLSARFSRGGDKRPWKKRRKVEWEQSRPSSQRTRVSSSYSAPTTLDIIIIVSEELHCCPTSLSGLIRNACSNPFPIFHLIDSKHLSCLLSKFEIFFLFLIERLLLSMNKVVILIGREVFAHNKGMGMTRWGMNDRDR